LVFADGAWGQAGEQHGGWRAADGYCGSGCGLRELISEWRRTAGWLVGHWAETGAVDLDDGDADGGGVGGADQVIGGIEDGAWAGALGVHAEDAWGVGGEVEDLGGAGLSVDGGGDCGLRFTGEFPGDLEVDLAAGDSEERSS